MIATRGDDRLVVRQKGTGMLHHHRKSSDRERSCMSHARRRPIRQWLVVLLASLVATAGLIVAAPATASAACAAWAPGGGVVSAQKQGGTVIVRTVFRFAAAEIAALHCTGSRSLEVDVLAYGGVIGGSRAWSSNLPNRYLDTEAFDGYPRVLTIGSDNARAIQPDVEYFTEIRLSNYTRVIDRPYAELYLNFQRGHRVSVTEPHFWAVCKLHGGSDPAWCNAPDKTVLMQPQLTKNPRIDLNKVEEVDTVAWGRYRKSTLYPNQRLNVGDKIYSPNNLNYLAMQSDGNLVEYIPGGRPVWASNTSVRGSIFIVQSDGNGVIIAPGNRPVWATGTRSRNSVLEIQDDRNVVMYAPGHVAVWSNGTAGGR